MKEFVTFIAKKYTTSFYGRCLLFLVILMIPLSQTAYAHPGRTDSKGGHYIRSSGFGRVGSYHYHNGGSESGSSTSYTPPPREYDKGYGAGYAQGYKQGYANDSTDFSHSDPSTDYKQGYNTGYNAGLQKGTSQRETDLKIERESLLTDDFNQGYGEGRAATNPSSIEIRTYSLDIERQKWYADGFQAGMGFTLRNDQSIGIKDGEKNYTASAPPFMYNDAKRQEAYENGFLTGKKKGSALHYKDKIAIYEKASYEAGYDLAFETKELTIPESYKKHFIAYMRNIPGLENVTESELTSLQSSHGIKTEVLAKAFEDGFKANQEVAILEEQGYQDGLLSLQTRTLNKGQAFYDVMYLEGLRTNIQEGVRARNQNITLILMGGALTAPTVWWLRKKSIFRDLRNRKSS